MRACVAKSWNTKLMQRILKVSFLKLMWNLDTDELQNLDLQKTLITKKFADKIFNQAFDRVQYDYQFNLNPSMSKLRKILKS